LHLHALNLVACDETSAMDSHPPPDARTSHLRTLSKIIRSGLSAFPFPSPAEPSVRPSEPPILGQFRSLSTPCERIFLLSVSRTGLRCSAIPSAGRALCTCPRRLGRGNLDADTNPVDT
jgi:hypothetical protein